MLNVTWKQIETAKKEIALEKKDAKNHRNNTNPVPPLRARIEELEARNMILEF